MNRRPELAAAVARKEEILRTASVETLLVFSSISQEQPSWGWMAFAPPSVAVYRCRGRKEIQHHVSLALRETPKSWNSTGVLDHPCVTGDEIRPQDPFWELYCSHGTIARERFSTVNKCRRGRRPLLSSMAKYASRANYTSVNLLIGPGGAWRGRDRYTVLILLCKVRVSHVSHQTNVCVCCVIVVLKGVGNGGCNGGCNGNV